MEEAEGVAVAVREVAQSRLLLCCCDGDDGGACRQAELRADAGDDARVRELCGVELLVLLLAASERQPSDNASSDAPGSSRATVVTTATGSAATVAMRSTTGSGYPLARRRFAGRASSTSSGSAADAAGSPTYRARWFIERASAVAPLAADLGAGQAALPALLEHGLHRDAQQLGCLVGVQDLVLTVIESQQAPSSLQSVAVSVISSQAFPQVVDRVAARLQTVEANATGSEGSRPCSPRSAAE